MKPYPKYKDSGIQWIEQIPEGWETTRGKNMMNQVTTKSNSSVKVALENIESESGKLVTTESIFDGNGIAFSKGDVLYGKLRPYLKKVWLAEFDGNAVGDFFVYRNKENSIPAFIKYLLLSDNFTKVANESTNGAKMPRVPSEFVLKLHFPLPPLSEQQAIAAYLDDKTSKLDECVLLLELQKADLTDYRKAIIDEAVWRNSSNAPTQRLKYALDLITEKSKSNRKVALENIESNTGKYIPSESEFAGNGIAFREGDIIYGKLRPYLRKVWLAEFEGNAVGDVFVYRATDLICAKYAFYIFISDTFTTLTNGSTYGAKMPRVSSNFIDNIEIALPTLSEQQAIAEYLDTKTAKIDEAIKRIDEQIADLRTYRTALISDVVTGKIDVRN